MIKRERTGALVWRLIYPLLIMLGVEIVIQFGFMLYFLIPGIQSGIYDDFSSVGIQQLTNDFVSEYGMTITILRNVILIPLYFFFIKRDEKYDIALERKVYYENYDKRFILLVLPLGIAMALGFNILISISGLMSISKSYKQIEEISYSSNYFIQILSACILAPLFEEFLMRGLLYGRLRYHLNAPLSIVITAALFGIIHGNIVQFAYAFLVGIVLAYSYDKFKTIVVPVILHCITNLTSVVVTALLPSIGSTASMGVNIAVMVVSFAVITACICILEHKFVRRPVQDSN